MMHRVLMLPGGVKPARLSYGDLVARLDDADVILKDHELYAADAPPSNWTLDTELDAALAAAASRGWNDFHLVGYSGGGGVALALIERHPDRVRSLALIEPAWLGSPTADDKAEIESVLQNDTSDPQAFMESFIGLPNGALKEMPEWMKRRPAGLQAMSREFLRRDLDPSLLARFRGPILLALGALSVPLEHDRANRVAKLLPQAELRIYEGTHHFEPPHQKLAATFARDLRTLWKRASTP